MRTTLTINDELYKTIKLHAIRTNQPVSAVIEFALTNQLLQDSEDIEDALDRMNEPTLSFDELVKTFKAEGLI
jgi:hypothetical protein